MWIILISTDDLAYEINFATDIKKSTSFSQFRRKLSSNGNDTKVQKNVLHDNGKINIIHTK